MFLFNDYRKKAPGFLILKNILNKSNIYFEYYDRPRMMLKNKEYEALIEVIKNDLRVDSGSTSNYTIEIDGHIFYKLAEIKNYIINLWLNITLDKITKENIEEKTLHLIKVIEDASLMYGIDVKKFTEKIIIELFIPIKWDDQKIHDYKRNINRRINHKEIIPSSYEELYLRSCNRVIKGSQNDYKNLVDSHIRILPFIDENNSFTIKKEYEKVVKWLVENKTELIEEFQENGYIDSSYLMNWMNIKDFEEKTYNNETKDIYKYTYKNMDKIIEILNLFDLDVYDGDEKRMRRVIDDHIKNNTHVRGMCTSPAYYEFIIGLAILQKEKKILDMKPNDFVDEIKRSLNLKFNSNNLIPKIHAPGGRPDINIFNDDGDIVAEPTIQLIRQTQMEADSIKSHVNTYNRNIKTTLFIAPKIENDIAVVFDAWFENNILKNKVTCFSTRELVDWLVS